MKWWPKFHGSPDDVKDAEERLAESRKLAAQSRVVSERLKHEIALNGWSEKFRIAMGRRA